MDNLQYCSGISKLTKALTKKSQHVGLFIASPVTSEISRPKGPTTFGQLTYIRNRRKTMVNTNME